MASMNRPSKARCTLRCAADMIGMFVRNQHRCYRLWFDTKAFQTADHFTRPKATIDKHTGAPTFDNQGITLAATAQRSKANHACRLTSIGLPFRLSILEQSDAA